jgi:hypothetical protein
MQRRSSTSVRVFYPEFDRTEVIQTLLERLRELEKRLPLVRVTLFGSYARGNYTVASDIDLLVVYAGEKREDVYALVKQALGFPRLEPHLYTEAEYRQAKDKLTRMCRGGVVLFPRGGGSDEWLRMRSSSQAGMAKDV